MKPITSSVVRKTFSWLVAATTALHCENLTHPTASALLDTPQPLPHWLS